MKTDVTSLIISLHMVFYGKKKKNNANETSQAKLFRAVKLLSVRDRLITMDASVQNAPQYNVIQFNCISIIDYPVTFIYEFNFEFLHDLNTLLS